MIEKMWSVLGVRVQFIGVAYFRFAGLQRETRVVEQVI